MSTQAPGQYQRREWRVRLPDARLGHVHDTETRPFFMTSEFLVYVLLLMGLGITASIATPHELFVHKLGAALTMEETILQMLENLREEASDPKLQKDLQQHYRETEQQVQNLARVFQALGEQPEKQACPAIEGLEKEGKQMIKEVDDSLVDSVILGGVIETEHHEIAVYDGLIIKA